jgi:uncharacterized membrane protein YtjA (UPF0391 family)
MFAGAITCLLLAIVAAVCGYGGVPSATAAALAQHLFLIGVFGFVISAVAVILGLDETMRSRARPQPAVARLPLDRSAA